MIHLLANDFFNDINVAKIRFSQCWIILMPATYWPPDKRYAHIIEQTRCAVLVISQLMNDINFMLVKYSLGNRDNLFLPPLVIHAESIWYFFVDKMHESVVFKIEKRYVLPIFFRRILFNKWLLLPSRYNKYLVFFCQINRPIPANTFFATSIRLTGKCNQ